MTNSNTLMRRDHRRPTFQSAGDAEKMRAEVLRGTSRTAAWFKSFDGDAEALFRKLKFEKVGYDPLTGEPLNVIEQINQSFTVLASLRAIELLLSKHPDAGGFRLALTTAAGRDIESVKPNLVAAEVFAATHPKSNQKLRKEVDRLIADPALYRYVFFDCPGYPPGRQQKLEMPGSNVEVISLGS